MDNLFVHLFEIIEIHSIVEVLCIILSWDGMNKKKGRMWNEQILWI